MKEKKEYQVYCYGDSLQEGRELQVKHTIICKDTEDLLLVNNGLECLEAMQQESKAKEREVYKEILQMAKQWEEQAAITQHLEKALEYLRTPEVVHTGNQWVVRKSYGFCEEISNRVYKMFYHISEETKFDRTTKELKVIAWRVDWSLVVNSPLANHYVIIAGQSQKRFTEKAAALKYLEGRKRAYAKLFTVISPVIPKQYQDCFRMHGMLLPGYTVESGGRMSLVNKLD